MSQNTHGEAQKTKVFTTTPASVIVKHIFQWALVGLLIGLVVMVALGMGIHKKLLPTASHDFVAYTASNESEPEYSYDVIDTSGITFAFDAVTYDGEEHVVEIPADQVEALTEKGITVTYYNNKHTNAGTYKVVAVLFGEGYDPAVLVADMVIHKADITDVSFVGGVYEYVEGQTYSATFTGTLPEGTSYKIEGNDVTGVGERVATLIVDGGINYNGFTITADIRVVDLKTLVSFPENTTFTYDKTEHKVELNTSKVSAYVEGLKVEYTTPNKATNAGEYPIVATVSAEGFTSFTVETTMTINKGDLETVAGLKASGESCVYDSVAHKATHTTLPEGVTAEIKYYLGENEVTSDEVLKPGTYNAVLTFTDANGNYETKTLEAEILIEKADISHIFEFEGYKGKYRVDEDNCATERCAELKYDEADITNCYGEGHVLDVTYYYNGTESKDTPKFTNVGTYEVKVLIKGNELYKDTELVATVEITYASYNSEISIESRQFDMVSVLGNKLIVPDDFKAPAGTKVEYLINGEPTYGVSNAGIYKMQIVFTSADGNYQSVKSATLYVIFNPIIVLVCIIAFALMGAVAGIITVLVRSNKEKRSEDHFTAPRAVIANARSGVVCESYARYDNKKVKGRLYLSNLTLEFYSDDYKSGTENFLIDLTDIRNVSAINSSKIQIYANREVHVFTVPSGRASEWVSQILNV